MYCYIVTSLYEKVTVEPVLNIFMPSSGHFGAVYTWTVILIVTFFFSSPSQIFTGTL